MSRKIIYTAGPITTPSMNERWKFHMTARDMAFKIWSTGHVALCPHLNTMFMDDPSIPSETFYKGDEALIRRCCDAMVMLPGWEYSKGSMSERQLAFNLHLPVFYHDEIDQMWDWLAQQEVDNASH